MADRAREYKPGERIPGTVYQVGRTIGAGGMGTVYDVEDTTIGKRYVLKTLHPQLGAREDLARRMQNEARQLARLHHPNIVEVITAGVTGDDLKLPYYVMERLNGQSLRLVLDKKGQLELPHAYHITIDLCDALDHAHDKGVIHRDVKPDNIFLHRTSAGVTVTKLLDFGILSLLDSSHRETGQRFLGTLRYAAPEQLRGEKPTAKMDVYAAALVLFEMAAGRGPFDDEGDPSRVAAAHIHKPPPLLSHFVVVPRELDALVNAALSKLPEHRPRDAFSFAASLRNLKRALGGPSQADSTENRATAAAVVGPDSLRSQPAPLVEVRQSSPAGPYVVQPAPMSPPPSMAPLSPQQSPEAHTMPRTTMKGMPTPTEGPSLAPAYGPPPSQFPTATSGQAVDRFAPTGSIVPQTPRMGQHGTSPVPHGMPQVGTPAAFAPTYPSEAPPVAGVVPFQWPVEHQAARSEEPQVRTVSGTLPPGVPRSIGPLVVAVLAGVALVALAITLLVVRLRPSTHASTGTPAGTVIGAPPPPSPVVAVPAPTLAPPGLDDRPPPAAPPSGAPVASATAVASTPAPRAAPPAVAAAPVVPQVPRASVLPAARPTPTAAPPTPARPGPGF